MLSRRSNALSSGRLASADGCARVIICKFPSLIRAYGTNRRGSSWAMRIARLPRYEPCQSSSGRRRGSRLLGF
jgi:hypothetical protein